MASCSKCGKSVGCGCNLVAGYCLGCYSEMNVDSSKLEPATRRNSNKIIIHNPPVHSERPNLEFDIILKDSLLTREEKLIRINKILANARENGNP